MEAATHPDLLALRTPAGKHELPVEQMREFCSQLARKPVRGGRKIGIIEDADDFNAESANSFLKSLEEPPPGVVLFLIATSTDRQLPTVLSRCQIVRFGPLSQADLTAILEEQGIDASHRERLARLSGGSVARALALNDDAIWHMRTDLIEEITSDRPNFARLAERWEGFVLEAGKDTAAQRTRASVVIGFLVDALRQSLRLALGADVEEMDPAGKTAAAHLRETPRCGSDCGTDREVRGSGLPRERRVQLILVIESVLEEITRVASSEVGLGPFRISRYCRGMKRLIVLAILGSLTGCSNAPVAGFLDFCFPE